VTNAHAEASTTRRYTTSIMCVMIPNECTSRSETKFPQAFALQSSNKLRGTTEASIKDLNDNLNILN